MTVGFACKFLSIIGVRRDRTTEVKQARRASAVRKIRPLDSSVAAAYPDNTVINSRYTFYNFLFLSIYEQFRRPLNLYFLLVACLQFVSVIAPVSPFSTLLPLLFAFTLTSLKEGYDDVKRHRQDAKYNNEKRTVLDCVSASWKLLPNYSIRVGDVILLKEDESIPCDVVVVAATSTVYIRTDNLDGELDLKPREIVFPHAVAFNSATEEEIPVSSVPNRIHVHDTCTVLTEKLQDITLTCPPPSAIIESFDGRAEFAYNSGGREDSAAVCLPMSHHHLLPQSCVLKRTKAALCVAVYTGEETKCSMNKRPPVVKWSKIDQDVSRYAIFVFCCQLVSAFSFGVAGYFLNKGIEERFWYLQLPSTEATASFFIYPLRFFLLTTVMIPVSFKCVVDLSKYCMTLTVEWDETMKPGGPSSEGCRVKNSDILEDLGQVDYVISDKTGTLTQSVMELLYVSVGDDRLCLHEEGTESMQRSSVSVTNNARVLHFGIILSLCNTVETLHTDSLSLENDTSPPQYTASSPDEEAMCRGSARLNVQLLHRDAREAVLSVNGVRETWIVHHVFPFSSELKSMGVIVEKKATGVVYFFVKGADDRIIEMTAPASPQFNSTVLQNRESQIDVLISHLNSYAQQGLRTLLVAEKTLSRDDLNNFLEKVRSTELVLDHRQEKLKQLRVEMETGVIIAGITAIEDKLQEGVQDTIRDFRRAGIKVWMLTGDKIQTAVQIGLACTLYAPGSRLIYIVSGSTNDGGTGWEEHMMSIPLPSSPNVVEREVRNFYQGADIISDELGCSLDCFPEAIYPKNDMNNESGRCDTTFPAIFNHSNSVLVVEGGTVLERILNTPELKERFAALSDNCVCVICARVTPSQKAALTHFVRSRNFMTLAVGDGGNDVAMLQEAHVGVGIMGKEGQQASRAADFSIHRFSDLRALVFVHGQQAYMRTAFIIKYSFYKSMLISFIQIAYNVVGTYVSGGTFWNSFGLTLWNGVYTLPQTLFFCLDRIAPRTVLERHTFLYKMTRHATDMNIREFFLVFMLRGAVQSVFTLWLVTGLFDASFAFPGAGWAATNDVTFSVAYSALIISQMLTMIFESHSITFLNALWIFGMPIIYVISTSLYSSISRLQYFGVWDNTINAFSSLAAFVVAFVLVFPVLGIMVLRQSLNPDPRDVLRTAAVRNRMRRQMRWRGGGFLSRLSRRLLCVSEEASYLLRPPSSAERVGGIGEV
ncbi:putative phospholipid-translocating P-type ATPase (flippase) [Trypanosoma rangeli]|uniref:Phospholipid-transporting ATPase n=1 Tax=Trypanosoma rangeli TaxID=5698 RepID=A0A3S5IS27_TRYRA|nr:putative phospholipid-translocating P-type ATPase (flippase) [Trypanosoma rangeli]RNF09721.1 putative phospholipid-translocating P-type ATPase (flippase) [Trypanosoma rangeli]|eukprot:RNF09721.1 putative phospholipid-translocating P-type ATPase (flippase) [Trypanosoma rangeli]